MVLVVSENVWAALRPGTNILIFLGLGYQDEIHDTDGQRKFGQSKEIKERIILV